MTQEDGKILYKELSYKIVGLLFAVQNDLGRYAREKQYGDAFAKLLTDTGISFVREYRIAHSSLPAGSNIADFVIDE